MKNGNESAMILGKYMHFTNIFRTFGIATRLWNILICFLALFVICITGVMMDLTKPVVAEKDMQGNNELEVFINNSVYLDTYISKYEEDGQRRGVFSTLWHFTERRFQAVVYSMFDLDIPSVLRNIAEFLKAIIWAFKYHFFYAVIFFTISLCMISIAGGAVCRTAALQFALAQKPGMTEALRYSISRFRSYCFAPLTPICFIIGCAFFIFMLGVLATVPFGIGEILLIIFLAVALLIGVVISLLLIGGIAGFNLMLPAISYEGTDSFGAMNHSFCYIYKKPWRMLFYTSMAAVYGSICYAFVRFFVFLLLWITHQSLQLGAKSVASASNLFGKESGVLSRFNSIWPEPTLINLFGSTISEPISLTQTAAHIVVYLVIWMFVLLLASFILSFYFSANTIIYALIRQKVDDTPINEIFTPEEMEELDFHEAEEGGGVSPESNPDERPDPKNEEG